MDTRYNCKCGANLSFHSLGPHMRTQKHIDLVELNRSNDFLVNKCLELKKEKMKLEILLSEKQKEIKNEIIN